MANPVAITIEREWEWVKIATSITIGSIHLINEMPCYFRTYRLTGEAAPDNPTPGTVPDEAVEIFVDETEESIRANELIDVYLFCKLTSLKNTQNGKVVVDA